MPNEEQDLLQVFREGDPEAFEKIVLKYQGPLMGFFFRLCWDRFLAEDLTQEVFLRMIKAAQSYKPSGKLDYFVFRIARNLWIDRVRKMGLRPKPASLDKPLAEDGDTLGSLLSGDSPDPSALASLGEEARILREAMKELPRGAREVFELAVYQGFPYKDVARILEIPVGTVKSRMFHALKTLKARLGQKEENEEGKRKKA